MRAEGREVAATGLFQSIYDNINHNLKNAEQTTVSTYYFNQPETANLLSCYTDSQENGICATITPLFEAKIEDIKVADFQEAFLKAPPLEQADILHTPEESETFQKNLIFTILRIITKYDGDHFKKFEKDLKKGQRYEGQDQTSPL